MYIFIKLTRMADFTGAEGLSRNDDKKQTQGISIWEMGRYGDVNKKQSIQKKHWLSLFPTMGQLVGTPCLHS